MKQAAIIFGAVVLICFLSTNAYSLRIPKHYIPAGQYYTIIDEGPTYMVVVVVETVPFYSTCQPGKPCGSPPIQATIAKVIAKFYKKWKLVNTNLEPECNEGMVCLRYGYLSFVRK